MVFCYKHWVHYQKAWQKPKKLSYCKGEVSQIDAIAVKKLMNNSNVYDDKYKRSS